MSIRTKIILIVLPLIAGPLVTTGYVASLTARNGITRVAASLLQFKLEELQSYAAGQWNLLTGNDLAGNSAFVEATKTAVTAFARNMIRSDSELILAVDAQAVITMSTQSISLSSDEQDQLKADISSGGSGWRVLILGGEERVCQLAAFLPFGWYFLVTERSSAFYAPINDLYRQTAAILIVSLIVSGLLLLAFAFILIQPLRRMVSTIGEIMRTNDLSKRVVVKYRDEIGELGHTFNQMTAQLEKANEVIKGFALQAVVAKHNERKIRNIFQKYVPTNVIEQVFANPESMLVGENRVLAILFSDIRGFTGISERLLPNELVESLNAYFGMMVDVIMSNNGIVDKYIGDAIMAFFGAPVASGDEAYLAVKSAFEMMAALKDFNVWQGRRGRPVFRTGIGINYGLVTVGNIGSDKKMDYTVIGDMVNLASRFDGLTKIYKTSLIVSESVKLKIQADYHCRLLDRVVVKGKSGGVDIYTVQQTLTSKEEAAWAAYAEGFKFYSNRDFDRAVDQFKATLKLLPNDAPASLLLDRSEAYRQSPPPADWDASAIMQEK